MERHPLKKYPTIGACGLDCGLCPGFHSGGDKPCPGCCGEAFWERHPSCPFITCAVKQRGLESCGECDELEFCPRVLKNLEAAKKRDSLISYRPLAASLDLIRRDGMRKAAKAMQARVDFLNALLTGYNDGRSKGFYCLAVQLLPLEDLKKELAWVEAGLKKGATPKDKAHLMRDALGRLASERGVELKLRK